MSHSRTLLALVLPAVLGLPATSRAGLITYGGDLAALLGGPVATPAVLTAGGALDIPFAASRAGVGSVRGTIHFGNSLDAMSGGIAVRDFAFQSFRPAGAGGIAFSLTVDQDFRYAGPSRVTVGGLVNTRITFTAPAQRATIHVFPFDVPVSPAPGGFPQTRAVSIISDGFDIRATAPMHLQLNLSLGLSDGALSDGPRINGPPGFGGQVAREVYVPSGGTPLPEPSAGVLVGTGLLGLLGTRYRRGRGGA